MPISLLPQRLIFTLNILNPTNFPILKFINNGLQCMSEILWQYLESADLDCLRRVGELLRVLVHVSKPFGDAPGLIPTIEPLVQETFLKTILEKFNLLASQNIDEEGCARWKENLILARLIHFVLNFKCTWSPASKEVSKDLCNVIFDLLLVGQVVFSYPRHSHVYCSIVQAKMASI